MVTGASSCDGTCPDQLPLTPFASTGESQCFARKENLFAVSSSSNRLTMLDNDLGEHRTLLQGEDELNAPTGLVFISPTTILISNSGSGEVLKLGLRTGVTSLFANVATPRSIIFDPISNQIAVASEVERKISFFNVADGELLVVWWDPPLVQLTHSLLPPLSSPAPQIFLPLPPS